MANKFLVIEGCNGVGKSTITEYLQARLEAKSYHYPAEFVSFRNEVKLDEILAALPRLTYYLAATLHLSDLVRKELKQGHVICDRYLASPLSLLMADEAVSKEEALELIKPFESYLLRPDLTLLLTASHATACARIKSRAAKTGKLTPVAQRIVDSEAFYHTREDASRKFAARLSPVVELDTTNIAAAEMGNSAWSLVAPRLGLTT